MNDVEAVERFNRQTPVGSWVAFKLHSTGWVDEPQIDQIDHPAWVDVFGQAVTSVRDLLTPVPLVCIEPLPQQPDGIEEDGRELPDPRRAAERVRAYIEMAGDGLYDVAGAKPLFGRDLEALTRALLADSTPTERAPLVVTLAVSDVL
jgi:hypothetical protein